MRVFDVHKIVQGIYGTRHCNKCINELRRHEIQQRIAQWTLSEPEDITIPISDLI